MTKQKKFITCDGNQAAPNSDPDGLTEVHLCFIFLRG